MRRLLITCVLLGMIILTAGGQTVWTLEDCVNYALEHNIDLARQSHAIEREDIAVQEGKWAFAPQFSASSSYTMSTGRVLDPTTYDFVKTKYTGNGTSSVSGDITIFEGGRKFFALNRAKLSLKIATQQNESLLHNLKIRIAGAYMELLCARENKRIAEETVQLICHQLERTQAMYDAGSVTETDVLQLRTQLSAARKDASSAAYSLRLAKLSLCDLLEVDDFERFEVAEPEEFTPSLAGWDREAVLESQPEIRSSALKKDLAGIDYKLAVSAMSPKLSLSAGYGTSYSDARRKTMMNEDGTIRYEAYPFFEQYADNGSAFVSLSLSIPILNGMTTRNGIKRARIAQMESRLDEQETRRRLRKQLIQAETDYESALEDYIHGQKELEYARDAFALVENKYNLGVADFLSWNTAAVELAKAKYGLSEAKYTYILRAKIMEFYLN